MASTNNFNTRIRLKYDSLVNWNEHDPILLDGEVGFATTTVNGKSEVLAKVGGNNKKWSELEFISAKAADVNTYAKQDDAVFKSTIESWVSAKVQDTNTEYTLVKVNDYQYKLQSKPIGGSFADTGVVIDIPNHTSAIQANTDAIALLNGTAAQTGSVAKAIADAIAALNLANTYEAKGAAEDALGEAKSYADGKASAAETAAKGHADGLNTAMDNRVKVVEAAIGEGGSVSAQITSAIEKLDVTDTAVDGQYVSAVNEVDGKVVISRKALPDYTEVYDAKGAAAAVQGNLDKEIERAQAAEQANAAAAKAADDKAAAAAQAAATADGKAVAAQNDVDALEQLVGVLPEGTDATTVVDYVNKKTAGIATDAALAELQAVIDEHETSLAVLEGGKEVPGSVAAIAASAVAEIVAGADASFDTLKEIADWIKSDTTGAAKMAADIDALEALVGDKAVATQISEAIEAALKSDGANKYALASELSALAERVGTAEGKISTAEGKISTLEGKVSTLEGEMDSAEGRIKALEDVGAQANVIETVKVNGVALVPSNKAVDVLVPTGALAAKDKVAEADLASELASKINGKAESSALDALSTKVGSIPSTSSASNVIAYVDEKVAGEGVAALKSRVETAEGEIDALQADSHTHANKAELDKIANGDVAKWNSAEKNAKDYADGLAKNYAAAVHGHEISEVNGLQNALNAKANDADLKAIAKSGNIKDLTQTTGDYVIFDCGTASTVI
jgi:hypothetical protein